MRRLQFVLALLVAVVLVAGGVAARQAGSRAPTAAPEGGTPTGAWFCPHGGGEGWATQIQVANPGPGEVRVRVTTMGPEGRSDPTDYTLSAETVQRFAAPSEERGSATMVEYFGGWVAAGWVSEADGDESGVSAEPCSPEAGRRLFLPDGTTQSGQHAYVVVMNPFNAEAVFTLRLQTGKEQPVTTTDLTNYVLKPHHSVAFEINQVTLEDTVAVDLSTTLGRVAAASLGIAKAGGIRAAIAVPAGHPRWILPGGPDNDSSSVVVMNPSDRQVQLNAELYTDDAEQTAAGTNNQAVDAHQARTFTGLTSSPSAVDLRVVPVPGGSPAGVATVRRTYGVDGDQGATAGSPAAARSWVVLPAVGEPPHGGKLVIANPGEVDAEAVVTLLGPHGMEAETEVIVPALRTLLVPTEFTEREPLAAVAIVCSQGVVVPAAVGYSGSFEGYAVSNGVPVPEE